MVAGVDVVGVVKTVGSFDMPHDFCFTMAPTGTGTAGAEAAARVRHAPGLESVPFRFDGALAPAGAMVKDTTVTHSYNFQPSLLQRGYRTFTKGTRTAITSFDGAVPTEAPEGLTAKRRRNGDHFERLAKLMKIEVSQGQPGPRFARAPASLRLHSLAYLRIQSV
jgi:hypothetical protein